MKKLLRGQPMGDTKPSVYIQKMRSLAGGRCDDAILRPLFLEQLPEQVQSILAVSKNTDLSEIADRIMGTIRPSIAAVHVAHRSTSVSPDIPRTTFAGGLRPWSDHASDQPTTQRL
ncbi:uncharacterized protein LOC108738705 [Agrilus planipennis]|uniref:Uncharacterized protein LOC108738705 n=1 Tax=Agrilus planipennis TaxID=224129 RepID=A0A1W4X5Y2_AGRPL|nr:uncharacterized protein LOC108738705 [Agrilus planipennis]